MGKKDRSNRRAGEGEGDDSLKTKASYSKSSEQVEDDEFLNLDFDEEAKVDDLVNSKKFEEAVTKAVQLKFAQMSLKNSLAPHFFIRKFQDH